MARTPGLNPVTVQPYWTTNRHNPTEQLPRLLAPRTKSLRTLRCCQGSLDAFCGGADDVDNQVGVGEHGNVAAGDLSHFGAHALRHEPFHVGVDSAVVLGDDVPAGLRSPGSSSDFRVEQVGSRHALGRPNELLFLLGQIACETVDAFRKEPDTSVR